MPQTSDLFAQAVREYERRSKTKWGLTDCASFVIMTRENVTEALTHDQHFQERGFRALLREP